MTNDGSNALVYDAENRVLSATNGSASGSYIYDGNNLRVSRSSGGTTTAYIFSGSKVIAEYDNGAAVGSPTREYVYSGDAAVAKIEAGATTYIHYDHLSQRFSTDSNQNYAAHLGQYPFGEIWYDNGAATKNKFTTYERDAESGNDYAQARYNVSRLGRFSSPDPIAGSTSDPQSLNRYSYVRNAPTVFMDTQGTCPPTVQNRDDDGFQNGEFHGGPTTFADYIEEPSPEPQAQPCQGNFYDMYLANWGGFSIDGGEVFTPDSNSGLSGLLGSSASNSGAASGGSGGGWVPDGTGGYYNPTTGCYTNRGAIYCNAEGFAETFGTNAFSDFGLSLFGPQGPGGPDRNGGNQVPYVDLKNLAACAQALYDVIVQTAVPAEAGSNGNFVGTTESGKHFSVETDVGSYSTSVLTLMARSITPVAGLTLRSNPNLNYLANDLPTAEMYPVTWVHELGHSLDVITTGRSNENSANLFGDCVRDLQKWPR